jgi:hypothetical protein
MIIGIDFDNTIVGYDDVFHRVAVERGLIPAEVPATKAMVRQFLVDQGQEDVWTEMQGDVYGTRMLDALPYPGALEFFAASRERGLDVYIVSHKTRRPYRGTPHDLHRAAQGWLEHHGFYDPARIGLCRERVFFELTKREKFERIARVGCTHFIDDLMEILAAPEFPAGVRPILFDPNGHQVGERSVTRIASWAELRDAIAADGGRSS